MEVLPFPRDSPLGSTPGLLLLLSLLLLVLVPQVFPLSAACICYDKNDKNEPGISLHSLYLLWLSIVILTQREITEHTVFKKVQLKFQTSIYKGL